MLATDAQLGQRDERGAHLLRPLLAAGAAFVSAALLLPVLLLPVLLLLPLLPTTALVVAVAAAVALWALRALQLQVAPVPLVREERGGDDPLCHRAPGL